MPFLFFIKKNSKQLIVGFGYLIVHQHQKMEKDSLFLHSL